MGQTYIIIPNHIDEKLDLKVGETAYIVKESDKPTKIIFCKGSLKGLEISIMQPIENFKAKAKRPAGILDITYDYAIVKLPNKIKLNQRKCEKLMRLDDLKGEFIILLK